MIVSTVSAAYTPTEETQHAYICFFKMTVYDTVCRFTVAFKGRDCEILRMRVCKRLPVEFTRIRNETMQVLHFDCDIRQNYHLLNNILALLDEYIPNFSNVTEQIPRVLSNSIAKSKVARSIEQQRSEFIPKFERHVENVMSDSLYATALLSMKRIHDKYGEIEVASVFEAYIIDGLIDELLELQETLIRAGYLLVDTNSRNPFRTILSVKSRNILLYMPKKMEPNNVESGDSETEILEAHEPESGESDTELSRASEIESDDSETEIPEPHETELARLAIDVSSSIRALNDGGYCTNEFNLLNLIANLKWACDQAKECGGFYSGVTYHDALKALAHGISNGQREDNRNQNIDLYDDLDVDSYTCERGRFKRPIEALKSILPEIDLIFDLPGKLIEHLQREVVHKIIACERVTDLEIAKRYLSVWLSGVDEDKIPGFDQFKQTVNADFNNMLDRFQDEFFDIGQENLKFKVRREIEAHVRQQASIAMGFSYIEMISPSKELLETEWENLDEIMRKQTEQSSLIAANSKRLRRLFI